MALDANALSRLKVKDLQRELKKRGLDTSGLKAVLLARLKENLQQEEDKSAADVVEEEKEQQEEKEETDSNEKEEPEESAQKSEAEQEKESREPSPSTPVDTDMDKVESTPDKPVAAANDQDGTVDDVKATGVKRGADAIKDVIAPDTKKTKLTGGARTSSPQPEDEDSDKPTSPADAANSDKAVDEDPDKTENQETTLRIDNFIRPFTLSAVKALVQEFGNFVEEGFWMDVIKTHCFVTYPNAEIKNQGSSRWEGLAPENGRALGVSVVEQTAMDVSNYGESNKASNSKSNGGDEAQPIQRQKVTIDEFFLKTETKPVLYYLPLTDEQVEQRKQRQTQRQEEGPPRKRRNRGGRKRRNRARFQRR